MADSVQIDGTDHPTDAHQTSSTAETHNAPQPSNAEQVDNLNEASNPDEASIVDQSSNAEQVSNASQAGNPNHVGHPEQVDSNNRASNADETSNADHANYADHDSSVDQTNGMGPADSANPAGSNKQTSTSENVTSKDHPKCYAIKLRGLPFSATESDVRDFLRGYKLVDGSLFLGINTFRGMPNGEAYVMLAAEDAREAALRELDRKQIGHRYIEVFPCSESEYKQAQRKNAGVEEMEKEYGTGAFSQGPADAVIRMRGLPFSATREDLVEFFEGYTIPDVKDGVHILRMADGRSAGEAFVQLATDDEAARAVAALHRMDMRGRYVELFNSTAGEARKAVGLSEAAMHRYKTSVGHPAQRDLVVEVIGLPEAATYKDIRHFFAPAQIRQHGIHFRNRDPRTGHPSGDAFVEFLSAQDVDIALAKNEEKIQGRSVEVRASSHDEMERALRLAGGRNERHFEPRHAPYHPRPYRDQPMMHQAQPAMMMYQQMGGVNPYQNMAASQPGYSFNPYLANIQQQQQQQQPAYATFPQGQQQQPAYAQQQPSMPYTTNPYSTATAYSNLQSYQAPAATFGTAQQSPPANKTGGYYSYGGTNPYL